MRGGRPKVLFRCDLSPSVGTGHVRRCLALGRQLRRLGARVEFACRVDGFRLADELEGVAEDLVEISWALGPEDEADEVARILTKKAIDLAVIDHYHADAAYQGRLAAAAVPWLQLDRRAAWSFLARWVLNPNPNAQAAWYRPLVRPRKTRLLLGPRYALLRSEFAACARRFRVRPVARRVLLAFGGGDDRGALLFFLRVLRELDRGLEIVALTSASNPRLGEIRAFADQQGSMIDLRVDQRGVARTMAEADLGIISAGTLAFESAAIGLPTLMTAIADNQEPIMAAWRVRGAALCAGRFPEIAPESAERLLAELLGDAQRRRALSRAGHRLVDGRGAERVAALLADAARS